MELAVVVVEVNIVRYAVLPYDVPLAERVLSWDGTAAGYIVLEDLFVKVVVAVDYDYMKVHHPVVSYNIVVAEIVVYFAY